MLLKSNVTHCILKNKNLRILFFYHIYIYITLKKELCITNNEPNDKIIPISK
jgi:hypothetical protein